LRGSFEEDLITTNIYPSRLKESISMDFTFTKEQEMIRKDIREFMGMIVGRELLGKEFVAYK
jgi:hypothetical protein